MQMVQVKDWGFCYPGCEAPALSHVNFTIEEGAFVLLCGASGSGKSTLLSHLKREMAPHGTQMGVIEWQGSPLSAMSEKDSAQRIGYVAQTPETQIVTDTVWHELAFGLENLGMPAQVMRRRVAEIAHFFGIESWFRQKTDTLSGGQKQLVNLASVLVMQPSLLILDEPTAQLDPVAARQFLQAVQRVHKELGITVLLCEHALEEVLGLATQVLFLQDGALAFDGAPQAFLQRMAAPSSAHFRSALPAASRLALSLGKTEAIPVTVQQGRRLLRAQRAHVSVRSYQTHQGGKASPVLCAKELWFRYQTELPFVLRGFSMSLFAGEIHALVGGNGCGKSTALAVLCGGYKPQRGKCKGKVQTALLAQDTRAMFAHDTVEAELRQTARIHGQMERWEEVTEKLQIAPLLPKHPYDISVGERQRAALAKCLLTGAGVLLLDEPTKGMDAFSKHRLAGLLATAKRMGQAVCLVTHDLEFAAAVADRCSMMFDGTVMATDQGRAFFLGNQFYTTAVHRMTQGILPGCVVQEDLVFDAT